jgi:hypothetical protein
MFIYLSIYLPLDVFSKATLEKQTVCLKSHGGKTSLSFPEISFIEKLYTTPQSTKKPFVQYFPCSFRKVIKLQLEGSGKFLSILQKEKNLLFKCTKTEAKMLFSSISIHRKKYSHSFQNPNLLNPNIKLKNLVM